MSDRFAERLLDVLDSAARANGDGGDGATLRLARRLGIGGFVRCRLEGSRADDSLDGESTLLGLAQGLVKEAAEELSATFDRRGIQHFFLKGAALAEGADRGDGTATRRRQTVRERHRGGIESAF